MDGWMNRGIYEYFKLYVEFTTSMYPWFLVVITGGSGGSYWRIRSTERGAKRTSSAGTHTSRLIHPLSIEV